MKFHIQNSQYVALRNGRVCFDHKLRRYITLSQRQFLNLHDIVTNIHRLHLQAFPLDNHVWIRIDREGACLCTQNSYFKFRAEGWRKYIRNIHPVIRYMLLHGERDGDQHDAFYARYEQSQPRSSTRDVRRQTLSRTPRDVTTCYEERSQRTTIPLLNSADSRESVSMRSGSHVSRTSTTSSNQHNDTFSDIELGDQCSIEDDTMSAKDCSE